MSTPSGCRSLSFLLGLLLAGRTFAVAQPAATGPSAGRASVAELSRYVREHVAAGRMVTFNVLVDRLGTFNPEIDKLGEVFRAAKRSSR